MKTILFRTSLVSFLLSLLLAPPTFADITMWNGPSWFYYSAATGYSTEHGTPKVTPYYNTIPSGQPASQFDFSDETSGRTETRYSSVDYQGAIDVSAELHTSNPDEPGHQYLMISIMGRAVVHSRRDPNFPYYSAGGGVSVAGQIVFTLSRIACYEATGGLDGFDDLGHSAAFIALPDGLPLRTAGVPNDPQVHRGEFSRAGILWPGTYRVTGKAWESHTLGGREGDHDLKGESKFAVNVTVSEDCQF